MKITNEIYNQAVEDIQRDNESFNEKAKELFPKNADLAGPVAAAHASLERALNKFIFTCNPLLKNTGVHFRFDQAVKIAVKMPPPFRIVPNEESLNIVHQSLIGLNKLRNHLVHPSDYSTEDIIKLYDPLLAYFRFYKLEDRLPTDVPINVRLNYVVTGYCSGLIGSIVTFDNFAASIAEQNSK